MHNTDYPFVEMAGSRALHNSQIQYYNAVIATKRRAVIDRLDMRMTLTQDYREQNHILERYYVHKQLDAMPKQVSGRCACQDAKACCKE